MKLSSNESSEEPITRQAQADPPTRSGEMQVRTRKQAVAKLMIARNEIDELLSVSAARYDPVVLSQTTKNDLAIFRDFLNQTIDKLQEEQ